MVGSPYDSPAEPGQSSPENSDNHSGRRIRIIFFSCVALALLALSCIAVYRQGFDSFIADLYEVFTVGSGMGMLYVLYFVLIHALASLVFRTREFLDDLIATVRKLGFVKVSAICGTPLILLIHFFVVYPTDLRLHLWFAAYALVGWFFSYGIVMPLMKKRKK